MAAFARGLNFGHLLKTGQYSDLTLACQGKEFKVHKVVVCSQSEVLAATIREPFQVCYSALAVNSGKKLINNRNQRQEL